MVVRLAEHVIPMVWRLQDQTCCRPRATARRSESWAVDNCSVLSDRTFGAPNSLFGAPAKPDRDSST